LVPFVSFVPTKSVFISFLSSRETNEINGRPVRPWDQEKIRLFPNESPGIQNKKRRRAGRRTCDPNQILGGALEKCETSFEEQQEDLITFENKQKKLKETIRTMRDRQIRSMEPTSIPRKRKLSSDEMDLEVDPSKRRA
jgi:hypothetical protein